MRKMAALSVEIRSRNASFSRLRPPESVTVPSSPIWRESRFRRGARNRGVSGRFGRFAGIILQ